MKNLT